MTSMANQADRAWCAPCPLEVSATVADASNISVHPKQAFPITKRNQAPTSHRKCSRRTFWAALSVIRYVCSTPSDVFDNLNEVNSLAEVQRLHATFDFLDLELCCLMHRYLPWYAPRMTAAIKVH